METQIPVVSSEKRAKAAVMMIYSVTIIYAVNVLADIANKIFFDGAIGAEEGAQGGIIITLLFASIAVILLALALISVVTFIMWLWRAYSNLHALGCHDLYNRAWTVAAWFIPFLNLYLPYKIMQTMFKGINIQLMGKNTLLQSSTQADGSKIGVWWTLWIISGFFGNMEIKANNLLSILGEPFPTILSIVSVVLLFFTANYAVQLIEEYTRAENILLSEEESDDNIGALY